MQTRLELNSAFITLGALIRLKKKIDIRHIDEALKISKHFFDNKSKYKEKYNIPEIAIDVWNNYYKKTKQKYGRFNRQINIKEEIPSVV